MWHRTAVHGGINIASYAVFPLIPSDDRVTGSWERSFQSQAAEWTCSLGCHLGGEGDEKRIAMRRVMTDIHAPAFGLVS